MTYVIEKYEDACSIISCFLRLEVLKKSCIGPSLGHEQVCRKGREHTHNPKSFLSGASSVTARHARFSNLLADQSLHILKTIVSSQDYIRTTWWRASTVTTIKIWVLMPRTARLWRALSKSWPTTVIWRSFLSNFSSQLYHISLIMNIPLPLPTFARLLNTNLEINYVLPPTFYICAPIYMYVFLLLQIILRWHVSLSILSRNLSEPSITSAWQSRPPRPHKSGRSKISHPFGGLANRKGGNGYEHYSPLCT